MEEVFEEIKWRRRCPTTRKSIGILVYTLIERILFYVGKQILKKL
jgi:hypothetical protein